MTETNATLSANARDAILASIRSNLATSAPFNAVHNEHRGHTDVAAPIANHAFSPDELIENFRHNLDLLGAHCAIVSNEIGAADRVGAIIEKVDAKRIAISDSALVSSLINEDSGVEFVKNASTDFMFDCDMGITSAQWAIAETGTLVLESEKESHRLTSLVPPVHLCVLKASCIRQTLGKILELTGNDLSRTMTFITGASRTSDIELTLAIGVHGPAELHVIVIADQ